MAIRVVYILDGKTPDVIEEAKTWAFIDGMLRIWSGDENQGGGDGPMIEICGNYVLSVEQVASGMKAVDAPKADEGREAPKNTS